MSVASCLYWQLCDQMLNAVCLQTLPKGVVITKAFPPDQKLHREHYIGFGPDGWLYLNQGAESNLGPCSRWNNVTRCTIMRLRPDGSDLQVFGRGEPRQWHVPCANDI